MVYCGAVGDGHGLFQNDFYVQLATELLENSWDGSSLRERTSQREMGVGGADRPRSGLSAHLTPTKRKRKTELGKRFPIHCSVTATSARGRDRDIFVQFATVTTDSCAECSFSTARRVAPALKSMFNILIWTSLNSSYCVISVAVAMIIAHVTTQR
jgi:hypothetical protein